MNNIIITCPQCNFQIDSKKELEEFEVKAAEVKAAAVAEAESRTEASRGEGDLREAQKARGGRTPTRCVSARRIAAVGVG